MLSVVAMICCDPVALTVTSPATCTDTRCTEASTSAATSFRTTRPPIPIESLPVTLNPGGKMFVADNSFQ